MAYYKILYLVNGIAKSSFERNVIHHPKTWHHTIKKSLPKFISQCQFKTRKEMRLHNQYPFINWSMPTI